MKQFKTLRELFRSKKRWLKDKWAATADGYYTLKDDPEACKFCLFAGVVRVFPDRQVLEVAKDLADAIRKLFYRRVVNPCIKKDDYESTIIYFNDHQDTTIYDVRKVIREAGH